MMENICELRSSTSGQKVSFGVKRKIESFNKSINLLKGNAEDGDGDEILHEQLNKKQKLSFVDNTLFANEKSENSLLIIPMVTRKDWRVEKILKLKEQSELNSEDDAKFQSLFPNLSKKAENSSTAGDSLLNNSFPEDADYNLIPVESFGLAVLRGCGWKDGEGIGLSNKKVVPLKIPTKRPKGLGLGADISIKKPNSKVKNGEKDFQVLKKYSYVKVINGIYRDSYGRIEGFDEDNGSVIVQLALSGNNVRVNQYALELISVREYERNCKYIIIHYNCHPEGKIMEKTGQKIQLVKKKDYMNQNSSIYKCSKKELPKSGDCSSSRDNLTQSNNRIWVQTGLRVRCISKRYKNGSLFTEKVKVIDVPDSKYCTVEDFSGRVHYDLKQDWLETIVPKVLGAKVLVINGIWRGSLAVMEAKDKHRGEVTIRILSSDDVITASFDDICEYTGLDYDEST